jgi:hypothetical protein
MNTGILFLGLLASLLIFLICGYIISYTIKKIRNFKKGAHPSSKELGKK